MSYEAEEFVKRMPIKSSGAKLIMLIIANRISNDSFICFPPQTLIAAEATKSVSQVQRHISNLVASKLLIRTERKAPGGKWMHNIYEIAGFREWFMRRYRDTPLDQNTIANAKSIEDDEEKTTPHFRGVARNKNHTAFSTETTPHPCGETTPHPCGMNPKRESKENPKEANKPEDGLISGKRSTPSAIKGGRKQGVLDVEGHEQAGTTVDTAREMDEADFAAYVALAREVGLNVPERLTAGRRTALRSIRAGYQGSGWRKALEAIRNSKFMQGENNRGWKVSLDQLLTEDFFVKVIEGKYADKVQNNVVAIDPLAATDDTWAFRVELWKEGSHWPAYYGPVPWAEGCLVPAHVLDKLKASAAE